jgi:hypothetical protein
LCAVLDIAELVRRGLMHPGLHHGYAEILLDAYDEWGYRAPITTAIGPEDGEIRLEMPTGPPVAGWLTLRWPYIARIAVQREDTAIGRWWRFKCPGTRTEPCGRLTRLLLLPPSPPLITAVWGCCVCWKVIYPDARRDLHAARLERLDDLDALERDLQRLREVMLMGLKLEGLDEPET